MIVRKALPLGGLMVLACYVLIATAITMNVDAQPQQSPIEQALSQKLMNEINQGLACSTQMVELRAKLETAEAKIKQLEDAAKPPPKTQ